MTVLSFPSSARDDAPDHEREVGLVILRAAWHDGLKNGYECLADALRWQRVYPMVRRARPEAVAAHSFEAWLAATSGGRQERRMQDIARASGLMAAWADHPQAEQCVNCDLAFVPGIEDGWRRCQDHGMTCGPACTSEACRVPSCREDDE